jgi:transcriptional regulator with XRE-family HTH domain
MTKQRLEQEASLPTGYLSMLERGKRGVKQGVGAEILRRLADTLDVRVEWLLLGTGTMQLEPGEDDPLPNRTTALRLAREGGVPEEVLHIVEGLGIERAQERSAWWWIEEIQMQHAMIRRDAGRSDTRGPSTAPPQTRVRRRADK